MRQELTHDVVDRYIEAWERGDVDAVVAMLTEDVAFAMPPLRSWFRGTEALEVFLAGWPLSGAWRWRQIRATANGQPAIAFYTWDEEANAYLPFALNVLTLRGAKICDVTAFVTRAAELLEREVYARWPEQPADSRRLDALFGRFGLPDRLD
jgi:RNA polymerase sigma-70 factor (ECF subfamily)